MRVPLVAGGLVAVVAAGAVLTLMPRNADPAPLSLIIRCAPDTTAVLRMTPGPEAAAAEFSLPEACYATNLELADHRADAALTAVLVVDGVESGRLGINPDTDLRSDPTGRYLVVDVLSVPPYLSVGDL